MKQLFITVSYMLAFLQVSANRIDSLQTDRNVIDLLSEIMPPGKNNAYTLDLPDSISCFPPLAEKKPIWKKMDFNRDGLMDLFAGFYELSFETYQATYRPYVIFAAANGKLTTYEIPPYPYIFCCHVEPILLNEIPHLLYKSHKLIYTTYEVPGKFILKKGRKVPVIDDTLITKPKIDTLVFRFGAFINVGPIQKNYSQVQSINFSAFRGDPYGSDYSISVDRSGKASFSQSESITEKALIHNGVIKKEALDRIFGLLHYMGIKNIGEKFELPMLHQVSSKLEITFSDGLRKTVEDIGLQGTMSLARLYELLFMLKEENEWQSTH